MPSKKIKKSELTKRKAKRKKDTKQDRRIKKLEQIVYPSLDWKTKDTKGVAVNLSTTPYQNYPMFSLTKGTNDNEREGDKVSLRHATFHLSLTRGDTSNTVRIIVCRTPSSTHLGLEDVLEYHNFSTDGELVFSSPYQVKATNSEKTYKIMYDQVFYLKNDISTIVRKIKLKLPQKGVECNFVGDSSVAPNNYNISLLMISDSTASPHPQADYIMRWKYIDL